jgi:hypothetical protein
MRDHCLLWTGGFIYSVYSYWTLGKNIIQGKDYERRNTVCLNVCKSPSIHLEQPTVNFPKCEQCWFPNAKSCLLNHVFTSNEPNGVLITIVESYFKQNMRLHAENVSLFLLCF